MSVDIQSPSLCLGIVGTGAMGRGIAQIAAQAGIRVLLFDALHGAAANAREAVVATLAKLAEKGKISADALAAASTRLEVVRRLDEMASAQVIDIIAQEVSFDDEQERISTRPATGGLL